MLYPIINACPFPSSCFFINSFVHTIVLQTNLNIFYIYQSQTHINQIIVIHNMLAYSKHHLSKRNTFINLKQFQWSTMNNGSQYYNHHSQITFNSKNPIKKHDDRNHHMEYKRESQKMCNTREL
jgi:hypothetical protein